MSRTYRRLKLKAEVTKNEYGPDDYWIVSIETHSQKPGFCNMFKEGCEAGFDSPSFKRHLNRFYTDSGSRNKRAKRWTLKHLFANQYREKMREELRQYLRQEDGELQSYSYKKYDFGFWFW